MTLAGNELIDERLDVVSAPAARRVVSSSVVAYASSWSVVGAEDSSQIVLE